MLDVQDDEGGGDEVADLPRAEADVRRALNVVLSREFPRSPIAGTALCARLNCCCTSVQAVFFGFLNATVIVSASPS